MTATKIHPLTGEPKKNGHARRELIEALIKSRIARQDLRRGQIGRAASGPGDIAAIYDAAQDDDEFRNYWANTDWRDADYSNNRFVRQKLVPRSRYEVQNNGYADGIALTYATDLVRGGPKLRMQTGSPGFNRMVEFQWQLWAKAIKLRRKLWCQAHAKHMDGEGFGRCMTNPKVAHPVKLDYVLYETDQVRTPILPLEPRYVDGVQFDEWGNPTHYDILPMHPGSMRYFPLPGFNMIPDAIPAKFVMHWYRMRRAGEHRAIPECTSTLNVGAGSRRFREATLGAAETAAELTLMLKTMFQPDELDAVAPMSVVDFEKRMMTALPMGWDAQQMRAEHPNATYSEFCKQQINEQARPKSMPYNKAACDSSSYNYASGRLDHQTYYASLDVDREDGNDLVLDPLFELWFEEAVRVFGWLGGDPDQISPAAELHSWDWPQHPAADVQSEANATKTELSSGQTTLTEVYSERGEDFEEQLLIMARDFGVEPDEMRQILRTAIFNDRNQQASMQQADNQAKQAETANA